MEKSTLHLIKGLTALLAPLKLSLKQLKLQKLKLVICVGTAVYRHLKVFIITSGIFLANQKMY
jgi:hypothetical protein